MAKKVLGADIEQKYATGYDYSNIQSLPVNAFLEAEEKPTKAKTTSKKVTRKKASKPAEPEYKLNPAYIEKKTRRVDLLLKPSVYEKLQAKCKAENKSFNDYMNTLLEEFTKEN